MYCFVGIWCVYEVFFIYIDVDMGDVVVVVEEY